MSWQEEMYADIKAYFEMPADAEVVSIDTAMRSENSGWAGDPWTVFVVEVRFRLPDGKTETRDYKYISDITEFFNAVIEAAKG